MSKVWATPNTIGLMWTGIFGSEWIHFTATPDDDETVVVVKMRQDDNTKRHRGLNRRFPM